MACCRFCGQKDQLVTMELERGYADGEGQPRVEDRGDEAVD